MELVREDGGVIELKEGQRQELGRGTPGFDDAKGLDKSVSRFHVVVELLRPASRKGKEVVGKSTALKLHVHVVGRNPICITTTIQGGGGAVDKKPPLVKFAAKGEIEWLAPGDKFALSIRRPSFYLLRECSPGSLIGDNMPIDTHRVGRITNSVESNLISLAETNVKELEPNSLDNEEEEGIARAVARRQRRKLEREAEQQKMGLSEQQRHLENGLEGDLDRVKPDVSSREAEESVVPPQTNHTVYTVNPISDFGFLVKGSEFQAYEKRSKTGIGQTWDWKIDKKGATGDDSFHPIALDEESKMDNRNLVKKSRSEQADEEEDEEWGGDTKDEEDQVSRGVGLRARSKVSTRSNLDQERKIPQTVNTQSSSPSGRLSKTGADLNGFVVEDSDPIEEDDEGEDEDEWMDDDEVVPHQAEKRPTKEERQKPACKYGSNCYRKNKEHLAQFSHPER
ncbi:unnamed protein product [Calypogeia fissa]